MRFAVKNRSATRSGLTLIELLVVLGIMVIIGNHLLIILLSVYGGEFNTRTKVFLD